MTRLAQCCQENEFKRKITSETIIDGSQRRRCWEINHFFKCPTIGMCLSFAEQKQLLKKTGILDKKDGAYDIHEKLVASLESENRLSRRVDNLLDRKYGQQITALLSLGAEAFTAHFKTAMANGEGAPALWAAGMHPHLPLEASREIFGEIHMTMHWTAEKRLQQRRKLARQEKELVRLRKRVKAQSGQHRSMQKQIETYRQDCQRLERELAATTHEKSDLKQALAELDRHQQMEGPGDREPQNPGGLCFSFHAPGKGLTAGRRAEEKKPLLEPATRGIVQPESPRSGTNPGDYWGNGQLEPVRCQLPVL